MDRVFTKILVTLMLELSSEAGYPCGEIFSLQGLREVTRTCALAVQLGHAVWSMTEIKRISLNEARISIMLIDPPKNLTLGRDVQSSTWRAWELRRRSPCATSDRTRTDMTGSRFDAQKQGPSRVR